MRSEVPQRVSVTDDVDDMVPCHSCVVHRPGRETVVVYVEREQGTRDLDFVFRYTGTGLLLDIQEHDCTFAIDDIVYVVPCNNYRIEKMSDVCIWMAFYRADYENGREEGDHVDMVAQHTGWPRVDPELRNNRIGYIIDEAIMRS